MARNSQIHEDPVAPLPSVPRHKLADLPEASGNDRSLPPPSSELRLCRFTRPGIAIDSEEQRTLGGLKNRRCMPSAADRRIDIATAGTGGHPRHDFFNEHRNMFKE